MRRGAPHNPFCSAAWTIPYEEDPPGLVAALFTTLTRVRRGQILGGEGTGKSTLLRTLAYRARQSGYCVHETLVQRNGSLPAGPPDLQHRPGGSCLLCLDEADRLSIAGLWALRWRWRQSLWVATTHRALNIPTLIEQEISPALARAVARRLLCQSPGAPMLVEPNEVTPALIASRGNLRNALCMLYDLYESRWNEERSRPSTPVG